MSTDVHAPDVDELADGPDSAPPQGPAPTTSFGLVAWLRWGWRQLTSMRTALVLLFLLAVASIPGSLLPQRGIDPQRVQDYIATHRAVGPLFDKLSLFDVFAAPWFAAIYLLLFTSLAGCVLPRMVRQAVMLRALPPPAPRNLSRLPLSTRHETDLEPAEALANAARLLAAKRFRLRNGDGWIATEKGYLREAGNLLFHVALLVLLVAVGAGALFGYKANVLLVEGDSFANTPAAYDAYHPGRAVAPGDTQPFTVRLDSFDARYITSGPEATQPSSFAAHVHYQAQLGGPIRAYDLRVNSPLQVDGAKVYLIGHGYAPTFQVTDGAGHVVLDQSVPFLPSDQRTYTSEGVIKVPDARPTQLGFVGLFVPTTVPGPGGHPISLFPAATAPTVTLAAYAGDLGLDSGAPQSVYQLDTGLMRKLPITSSALSPGQSIKLPAGAGTIAFTGYKQWISLAITYDPGRVPALASGVVAIIGLMLSLLVRRRRVWVRAATAIAADGDGATGIGTDGRGSGPSDDDGTTGGADDRSHADAGTEGGARNGSADRGGTLRRTVVEVAGLARSDVAGGFEAEFGELAAELRAATTSSHAGVTEGIPHPAPNEDPSAVDPPGPPRTNDHRE